MPKALLDAEELRKKGLAHIADLLSESKEEDDEEEEEEDCDDEEKEDEKKDDEGDDKNESLESVLAGLGLDETVVGKMKELFESAVAARSAERLTALEDEIELRIESQKAENDRAAALYVEHVVENWKKEHEVPLINESKVRLAESFLTALHDLFEEHQMLGEASTAFDEIEAVKAECAQQIEESKAEVETARSELVESQTKLNEAMQEIRNLKLEKEITALKEGMTLIQAEKFDAMVKEVEINEGDTVEVIVERFVAAKGTLVAESQEDPQQSLEMDESVVVEKPKEESKPNDKMSSYLAAAKKLTR